MVRSLPRRGLILGASLVMCAGCLVTFEDYPVAGDDGGSGSPDAAFGGSSGSAAGGSAGTSGTGGTVLDGSSECDPNEACVAVGPADWSDPIAFWNGLAAAPSCPPEYPAQSDSAFAEMIQGGCSPCTCGAFCKVSVALFDDALCGGGTAVFQDLDTACHPSSALSPSSLTLNPAPGCSIEPPGTNPAPLPSTFTNTTRTCDLTAAQQPCSAGICRPIPPAGFNLCIYKIGDVPCPGAGYEQRTVTYSGIDAQHTCAGCDCQAAGSCYVTVGVANDGSCTNKFASCASSDPCCAWPDAVPSVSLEVTSSQGASCTTTGGEVQGQDLGVGPITYCCL